jgi:hypothetical protein
MLPPTLSKTGNDNVATRGTLSTPRPPVTLVSAGISRVVRDTAKLTWTERREKERETDRQRETDRERRRGRDRQTERDGQRKTEGEREKEGTEGIEDRREKTVSADSKTGAPRSLVAYAEIFSDSRQRWQRQRGQRCERASDLHTTGFRIEDVELTTHEYQARTALRRSPPTRSSAGS